MPDDNGNARPARSFWVISAAALVWNLIGVASYLMTVTISAETLNAMPVAERSLYQGIPAWVTSSYALAVFGGTLASALLLARRAGAVSAFYVSLLAIIVQMTHTLFMSAIAKVRGPAAAALPVAIIIVAVYLLWYSRSARARGWLR